MGTPWDRAAVGYLEEWVPRFLPYHHDLIREMVVRRGDRVLVTSAGPGAEVLAVARTVEDGGFVRATDKSPEMVRICREHAERARLAAPIECSVADASDVGGGPYDGIVCAFGLWQLSARDDAMRAWRGALAPHGKVGVITWGPTDPAEPFAKLNALLHELEPACALPDAHVRAGRGAMAAMFEEAGLVMVRHTIVRHTLRFESAERFVRAMREACTWRRVWEELGDARLARVATRFYDWCGGPDRPLSLAPPATLAIAALPGAEVDLEGRPQARAE